MCQTAKCHAVIIATTAALLLINQTKLPNHDMRILCAILCSITIAFQKLLVSLILTNLKTKMSALAITPCSEQ